MAPEAEHTGFLVTGASVRGADHKRNADAFMIEQVAKADCAPWLFIAVADGAGSARYGHRGAIQAVEAARQTCRAMSMNKVSVEAVQHLREEALNALRANVCRGATLADYHTTLLIVIADAQNLAALQIGDGAILVSDDQSQWRPLFWPSKGAFINETWFLTSADPPIQTAILPRPPGFALFTDGFEPMALDFEQRSAASGLFSHIDALVHDQPLPAQRRSRLLRTILQSEPVRRRSDDDCTLVLARCEPA